MIARILPRACLVATIIALVVGLAVVASPVAAKDKDEKPPADISGTYNMSGTFVNGTEYTGTVEIKKRKVVQLRKGPSFTFCDLKFHYSTGWEGIGVGAIVDGRFYFAIAHEGKLFSVIVYRPVRLSDDLMALKAELDRKQKDLEAHWAAGEKKNQNDYFIKGDPWYTDVWRYNKYAMHFCVDGDWGTETLRPPLVDGHESYENPPLGQGEWWFSIRHYSDKGKDESAVFGNFGQLIVEAPGEGGGIKVTRTMYDERNHHLKNPWACAGLMPDPETLAIVSIGDGSEGVGYYNFEGNTLKGRICEVDGYQPYEQTLTAPAEVISRNPELFK